MCVCVYIGIIYYDGLRSYTECSVILHLLNGKFITRCIDMDIIYIYIYIYIYLFIFILLQNHTHIRNMVYNIDIQ